MAHLTELGNGGDAWFYNDAATNGAANQACGLSGKDSPTFLCASVPRWFSQRDTAMVAQARRLRQEMAMTLQWIVRAWPMGNRHCVANRLNPKGIQDVNIMNACHEKRTKLWVTPLY